MGTMVKWWNNMDQRRLQKEMEIAAAILWRTWQNRYEVCVECQM